MKIDGLQIETLKGKYARYGLTREGKMQVLLDHTAAVSSTCGQFTFEENKEFTTEKDAAAWALLVDDKNQTYAPQHPAQDKPRVYTMEDFKQEQKSVTFASKAEAEKMIQECEKAGCTWRTEREKNILLNYPTEHYLTFNYHQAENKLSIGTTETHSTIHGDRLVPFSSFSFAQPTPEPTVTYSIGTVEQIEQAIKDLRHRRWVMKGKPGDPMQEVDRPAKVGEYIIITKANSRLYKSGQIFKVEGVIHRVLGDCPTVNVGYATYPVDVSEYRVLPNYHPEAAK